MARLLLGVLVVAALAAAVALLPVGGRTVLARWEASSGPGDFARRGWAEARGALLGPAEPPRPARPARASRAARPPRAARPAGPAEQHSDADRAALDRLVSERSR